MTEVLIVAGLMLANAVVMRVAFAEIDRRRLVKRLGWDNDEGDDSEST